MRGAWSRPEIRARWPRRSRAWPEIGSPGRGGWSECVLCARRRRWRLRWLVSTTRPDRRWCPASRSAHLRTPIGIGLTKLPAVPPATAEARRALITGLTGQDGSFLAELLLERGYRVTGLVRGEQQRSLGCSEHLRERVGLVRGDLLDRGSLRAAIEQSRPAEIYHLGGPPLPPAP